MPLEAIVFDFDGVLANTEPLHLNAYQHVLAPIGITLTVEEYYDRYLGLDDQAAFRALAREKPLALNDELLGTLIERKTRYYQALVKDKPVLFPGATECVRRCAGEAPLAIASGALRDEIEIVLRANDLTRFFRAIVAAGETPLSKPAPDPYARAVERVGATPGRCVAIEDSGWGLASAIAAGLRCVGVTHTYPAGRLSGASLIVGDLSAITVEALRKLCDNTFE